MYILRVFIIIVISALVKMGHKLNCDMRRVTSQGLLPYVYKVLVDKPRPVAVRVQGVGGSFVASSYHVSRPFASPPLGN